MTPESTTYIKHAQVMLGRAQVMLTAALHEDAGRAAYLACFHVVQGYIFERTGRVSKTHRGVQTEFLRLTRSQDHMDDNLRGFLSRAYQYKSIADYFSGSDATISAEDAAAAIATAERFVTHVAALIAAGPARPEV